MISHFFFSTGRFPTLSSQNSNKKHFLKKIKVLCKMYRNYNKDRTTAVSAMTNEAVFPFSLLPCNF